MSRRAGACIFQLSFVCCSSVAGECDRYFRTRSTAKQGVLQPKSSASAKMTDLLDRFVLIVLSTYVLSLGLSAGLIWSLAR